MRKTLSRIWAFSQKRHGAMLRALGFAFLRSVFGAFQLYAIMLTVGVLTGQTNAGNALPQVALCTGACVVGNFAASYLEQTAVMHTGFYMAADKRIELGGLLRQLPLGFFTSSSVGRITATLTTTLSGLETASVMTMVGIVSGLFNTVALFVFMLFLDLPLGLLAGAGMLVYIVVIGWQMALSHKNAPDLQAAQTRLADAALTFLQGIKVTKAFSVKNGDTALNEAIEGSRAANLRLTDRSMPSQFAAGLVIAGFESAILLTSVAGGAEAGHTVILLIFSFMVYSTLAQAGSMLSMIGMLESAISEVEELAQTPPLKTASQLRPLQDSGVEFDHVSFSYGSTEVLHDISLTIQPGTVTAIIGPSGSGKTTLCELVPRFHDVTRGAIRIGGVDLRELPEKELMAQVSMVFQQTYLFEDTVLNNIRIGRPEATENEVMAAARAAQCHSFIMALPQGYNTLIGEGGSTLSGGEKQRISIARAILKDAPIIILDEATSALDAENEREVLSAIAELTKNKTVIMIAHRLHTVQKADRIAALENGQLVQSGTPAELLEQEGIYRRFIEEKKSSIGWRLKNS